jgi:hypothetical protein
MIESSFQKQFRSPEAANESLCEDIMPPSGKDALESIGEGLRWVLPLQAVSPLPKESTVALSLARLLER